MAKDNFKIENTREKRRKKERKVVKSGGCLWIMCNLFLWLMKCVVYLLLAIVLFVALLFIAGAFLKPPPKENGEYRIERTDLPPFKPLD
jgi:uncharacterized membrane protein